MHCSDSNPSRDDCYDKKPPTYAFQWCVRPIFMGLYKSEIWEFQHKLLRQDDRMASQLLSSIGSKYGGVAFQCLIYLLTPFLGTSPSKPLCKHLPILKEPAPRLINLLQPRALRLGPLRLFYSDLYLTDTM